MISPGERPAVTMLRSPFAHVQRKGDNLIRRVSPPKRDEATAEDFCPDVGGLIILGSPTLDPRTAFLCHETVLSYVSSAAFSTFLGFAAPEFPPS